MAAADPLQAKRKALSDPIRLRMREQLAMRNCTVKQLGAVLGVEPNRLYYHARILESADLIEVVGNEVIGRTAEKVYGCKGGGFGDELPGRDPVEHTVFMAAIFDATKAELQELIFERARQAEAQEPQCKSIVLRGGIFTSVTGFDTFVSKLRALLEESSTGEGQTADRTPSVAPDSEGVRPFALTIAVYEHLDRRSAN